MIKKLQSNKGATFIIALIYFLICMMVGASMITAAAADRGRIQATVEEQRTYFMVSSAATTFRDKFLNAKFSDEFDYYSGAGTGNPSDYEAYARSHNGDEHPLPNQRFISGSGDENINKPELNITQIKYASNGEAPGGEAFSDLYSVLARFSRDIFYKEINKISEARSLGYNMLSGDHSFKATMTLEDSSVPIIVTFSMIGSDDDYAKLDTYDILMEFKNDITGTNDKEYCVSLLLKATRGTDLETTKTVEYVINRPVTGANGVTSMQPVTENIEISTIPLTLIWETPEIIMGTLEN